jgi:membrane protein
MSLTSIFRRTYASFDRHNPSRFGAALAFYVVFTVGPALLLSINAASRIFGRENAQRQILGLVASFFGDTTAAAVKELVHAAAAPNTGWLATAIGLSGLFFGVSGMYRQIRDALRAIWHVEPAAPVGWMAKITHRLTSIALVLGVSLLLFVSALADAAIAVTGRFAASRLVGGEALWHVVQLSLSTLVLSLLFAAIFRYLPKQRILWRDVAVGAVVTSVLFVAGKFLLGLYLGKAAVGSRYGPAGSIVVVMVWAYWSAQIFFFGLELTHMYADAHHLDSRGGEE